MGSAEKAYPFYPEPEEIDKWCDSIWQDADRIECKVEVLNDNGWRHDFGDYQARLQLVKFMPADLPAFYGAWQPALSGEKPLAVHLPGYGGELSVHPEIAAKGFNVLNLSPMGYWTPEGIDLSRKDKQLPEHFPVLPDTLRSNRKHGYNEWLRCVIYAVRWAWTQSSVFENRVSFYGTSQGGGASVLAGSLFKDHGIRCIAADEPFLTDYPAAKTAGAYHALMKVLEEAPNLEDAYRTLAVADTLAHTHRINCPILVTEGEKDTVCPPFTMRHLHSRLGSTSAYISFANRQHGYSYEFARIVETWLFLYA